MCVPLIRAKNKSLNLKLEFIIINEELNKSDYATPLPSITSKNISETPVKLKMSNFVNNNRQAPYEDIRQSSKIRKNPVISYN